MGKNKTKNKAARPFGAANNNSGKKGATGGGDGEKHGGVANVSKSNNNPVNACSSKSGHFSTNVAVPTSKRGVPDGYVTTAECDVQMYSDLHHVSIKKWVHAKDAKSSSRGSNYAISALKSQVISSVVEDMPVLQVLEKEFDLTGAHKTWCCFGNTQWKAFKYAHELSTNFSSPTLCAEEEVHAGSVDFVSDWTNLKALLKSHGSDSHLSFFLHRIGNSLTIDHLDLIDTSLFPNFLNLPSEFVRFVKDVQGESVMKKIRNECKSYQNVLTKEAYHKTLHASMKRPMKVDFSSRKGPPNSDIQFLHHMLFSTKNFRILVGSNVPVFQTACDAFPSSVTVRSVDGGTMSSLDALDLWLDNTLMHCQKSQVSFQKDWKITKTQLVDTNDLPTMGKFDAPNYMDHGEKLLQFLHENVKAGSSYWLYRAPGSFDITLYNISNMSKKSQDKENLGSSSTCPIFDKWSLLSPYLPYFGMAALTKYSEYLSEVITEKLVSETIYNPVDAAAILDEIVTNKKTDNKFPGSGHHHASHKIQKLFEKLEQHSKGLHKYISPKNGMWIIHTVDEVSSRSFNFVVQCIQGIYSTAIALTPNMQNFIYRHAVERYFSACFKLVRSLGPENKRLKFWDANERMRQFMIHFSEGVCNMLSCLLEWHKQVQITDTMDRQEWMYLACRMNILYADILGRITTKIYEKVRVRLPPDAKLPCAEKHEKIIQSYEMALKQIPNENSFKVKHWFVCPSEEPVIMKEALMKEVYKKMARANLLFARFHLLFPSYLQNVIGSPSIKSKSDKKYEPPHNSVTYYLKPKPEGKVDPTALVPPPRLTQIRIKTNYEIVWKLFNTSLEFADKANPCDDEVKGVKILCRELMGDVKLRSFRLDNATISEYVIYGEGAAAAILKCLEVSQSGENDVGGMTGGTGRDHFKTALHAFKETSVSQDKAPVVLVKTFTNGEALSEAIDSFTRASQDTRNESERSILKATAEALIETEQYLKMVSDLQKDEKPIT